MAKVGDTIKLAATFYNWNGQMATPEDVVLRLFDKHKRQIGEDIEVLPVSEGYFEYEFVVPSNFPDLMYFEYMGILEGKPAVDRGTIEIRWI